MGVRLINLLASDKQNTNKTIRVVAVGDNLIHPVVYKDAQTTGNSFDFKPMYQPVKKTFKKQILLLLTKSPH